MTTNRYEVSTYPFRHHARVEFERPGERIQAAHIDPHGSSGLFVWESTRENLGEHEEEFALGSVDAGSLEQAAAYAHESASAMGWNTKTLVVRATEHDERAAVVRLLAVESAGRSLADAKLARVDGRRASARYGPEDVRRCAEAILRVARPSDWTGDKDWAVDLLADLATGEAGAMDLCEDVAAGLNARYGGDPL